MGELIHIENAETTTQFWSRLRAIDDKLQAVKKNKSKNRFKNRRK